MDTEREVLEFVIVPPYNDRRAIFEARERLSCFLQQKFPGYTFTIVAVAPVDDEDEFNVVPVMSFVDDTGRMRMCIYPKIMFMADIAAACRTFDKNLRGKFAVH